MPGLKKENRRTVETKQAVCAAICAVCMCLYCLFPVFGGAAYAAGGGEDIWKISFGLKYDNEKNLYSFENVSVSADADIRSIRISYPSGLELSGAPETWKEKALDKETVQDGDSTTVLRSYDIGDGTGNEEVKRDIEGLSFTSPDGKTESGSIDIEIAGAEDEPSGKVICRRDESGSIHYYEYVVDQIGWTDAYRKAKSRTFMGMRGYLATITSQEEQDFIYNNINDGSGWLGGTRYRIRNSGGEAVMLEDPDSVDAEKLIQDDISVSGSWYWACGPEGAAADANKKVFYGTPTSSEKGNIEEAYSNFNHNEPNNDSNIEGCLQFAFKGQEGRWNDLPENGSIDNCKGYYVEYSRYKEKNDGDDLSGTGHAFSSVLMKDAKESGSTQETDQKTDDKDNSGRGEEDTPVTPDDPDVPADPDDHVVPVTPDMHPSPDIPVDPDVPKVPENIEIKPCEFDVEYRISSGQLSRTGMDMLAAGAGHPSDGLTVDAGTLKKLNKAVGRKVPGTYSVIYHKNGDKSGSPVYVVNVKLKRDSFTVKVSDRKISFDPSEKITKADIISKAGIIVYDEDGNPADPSSFMEIDQKQLDRLNKALDEKKDGTYTVSFFDTDGNEYSIEVKAREKNETKIIPAETPAPGPIRKVPAAATGDERNFYAVMPAAAALMIMAVIGRRARGRK